MVITGTFTYIGCYNRQLTCSHCVRCLEVQWYCSFTPTLKALAHLDIIESVDSISRDERDAP